MAVRMTSMVCGTCGIAYAMPESLYEEKKKDGSTFYCPSGHARHFAETQADKLRRERDRLAQQVAERDDSIRQLEAKHAKELASIKKRTSAGVCPCCNRTFAALQRHIAHKHPAYAAEGGNVVPLVKSKG